MLKLTQKLLKILNEPSNYSPGARYDQLRRIQMRMRNYPTFRVNQAIKRLSTIGYVQKQKKSSNQTYSLTIMGRQKLLMNQIRALKHNPKDGTSCIIIF